MMAWVPFMLALSDREPQELLCVVVLLIKAMDQKQARSAGVG